MTAPRFLHVPWIGAHGDWLVGRIAAEGGVAFAPLRLFPDGDAAARRDLLSLGELRPAAIAQGVRRRLRALGGVAHGLLLTHDWPAPLRIVAQVADALGLPTVLVPHESVFFSRANFYRDARGPLVAPACRHVLAWGGLHREVFLARGAPAGALQLVGSPKLDHAARFAPTRTAAATRAALGLGSDRPFALFAMQPMDNARDPARARRMQIAAIRDLAAAAAEGGATLVVRAPPAGRAELLGLEGLDGAPCRIDADGGPLLEIAAHAALVASVGSTALVEAHLMGRPTLQVDYDRDATGAELRLGAATAHDPEAARAACLRLLAEGYRPAPELDAFLDAAFGPGRAADGGAAARIADALRALARPVDLAAAGGAGWGVDRLALFAGWRRLGASRRLAARLA